MDPYYLTVNQHNGHYFEFLKAMLEYWRRCVYNYDFEISKGYVGILTTACI